MQTSASLFKHCVFRKYCGSGKKWTGGYHEITRLLPSYIPDFLYYISKYHDCWSRGFWQNGSWYQRHPVSISFLLGVNVGKTLPIFIFKLLFGNKKWHKKINSQGYMLVSWMAICTLNNWEPCKESISKVVPF